MSRVSKAAKKNAPETIAPGLDDQYERNARVIHEAVVLVLLTEAGFSACSGLAVYDDVAQVAAYKQRDLTYMVPTAPSHLWRKSLTQSHRCCQDGCRPQWLDSEPDLYWGFWGGW
jgi:hypothetical protein